MQSKNSITALQNKLSNAKMLLYDLQVFIKFGALASDSNIIDEDLQLNKSNDDYYVFFRTLNEKLKTVINTLDS